MKGKLQKGFPLNFCKGLKSEKMLDKTVNVVYNYHIKVGSLFTVVPEAVIKKGRRDI